MPFINGNLIQSFAMVDEDNAFFEKDFNELHQVPRPPPGDVHRVGARRCVKYATEQGSMRRSHVKKLSAEKDIPTLTDGCACDPAWSAWIWKRLVPRRHHFEGCVEVSAAQGIGGWV